MLDKPLESGSLGTLLMDFLHYFGMAFPYDDSYISVTHGKLLPKETADWINHSGRRDKLVIQCLVDPRESHPLETMLPFVDMNTIENDVGKSAGKIEQIKAAFRDAHDSLANFPFTTSHTDILGIANVVRITQKVRSSASF